MLLPAVDTIKDLLTGSFSDKFKALLEPYALVNASIFLTLNLALVYPLLAETSSGAPFVARILGLSPAWLVVVGTISLSVLAYLIGNMSGFFLDLVSGEIFKNSWLLGKYRWFEEQRWQELVVKVNENPDPDDEIAVAIRNQAAYWLAYDFPVKKDELGLTRLGNLLISPASYVTYQYGANLEILWPVLEEKLKDEDKPLKLI